MEAFFIRLSGWLASFAGAVLVVIMVITFIDVIGRYFFSAPLTFAIELIELGMGLLICFGLTVTTLRRGHISVDLLGGGPGSFRMALSRFLTALTALVFLGLISWRLYERSYTFMGDGLATQVLFLPVFPVVFLMAVASTVATIVAAIQVIRPSLEEREG